MPTERARAGGLGVVVFAANAGRTPSHAVGRGSSSPTPRQIGGCGFEASQSLLRIPCRAARVRFATWRTGRMPTEHARTGGLGVDVFAANAGRTPSHAIGRGSSSPTPRLVGGCGFATLWPQVSNPMPCGPPALGPVENRLTAHGACARWQTWRGCFRGQCGAHTSPRRWPRLFFSDTAPGRRIRLRVFVAKMLQFRAARPARASPRAEPAGRPQSTRALADLAGLSLWPTRDALQPMPWAEALTHRHRGTSAAGCGLNALQS